MSSDGLTCTALPNVPYCLSYMNYKCKSCNSGYFLNHNLYLENFQEMIEENHKLEFLDYLKNSVSK